MNNSITRNGSKKYKKYYSGKYFSIMILITFFIGMGTYTFSTIGDFSAGNNSDQKRLETSTDFPARTAPKKLKKIPTTNHREYYDPTQETMYAANTQNVEILTS